MANIIASNSVSMTTLMSRLEQVKYNPSSIQRIMLDYLDEVTAGEVNIVDPTNPFVFLLESSAVNTALAVNESLTNLRKQYPSLAQTEDELYLHMSDHDYVDRFAVPAETVFTVAVQVLDLYANVITDPVEGCDRVEIPRDSVITVDGLPFTLQYPITIKRYPNGVVSIMYDAEIPSPLQGLTTNIIDYTVRKDDTGIEWIFFGVPVKQMQIETSYHHLQASAVFAQDVTYQDRYYYCRIWYRPNDHWIEMAITHTDQVFNPTIPTAVLHVYTGMVNVFIPTVYLSTGLVSGEIRVDIYSTRGSLSVNLSTYKLNAFEMELKAIDEDRDLNVYTNAMSDISYHAFNYDVITGGTNGIDFLTLRDRVIYNSVGSNQLPITNIQIESYVQDRGFDLIRNIDVVTNRIFLATRRMPKPLNAKLITAANMGIASIVIDLKALSDYSNIRRNGDRVTLLSDNLYTSNNDQLSLVSDSEYALLMHSTVSAYISRINTTQYLYTPFHYVLDSSQNEFEVRAYALQYPSARDLSFVSQNQTVQLAVNTGAYILTHVHDGYILEVTTKSGEFYKATASNEVDVQIGFYGVGQNAMAYIPGTLKSIDANGERVYTFFIQTNYNIDHLHHIQIVNARLQVGSTIDIWVSLDAEIHLLYTTTSIPEGFTASPIDTMLCMSLLQPASVGITHERLQLHLGSALKALWTRSRTFASGLEYDKYRFNVPMVYAEDVYALDPVTNSIFNVSSTGTLEYVIEHHAGDPVLNAAGDPVYLHRAGDPVVNTQGQPTLVSVLSSSIEFDMLMIDGRYAFANDSAFVEYRQEISEVITSWVTVDLQSIQDILLEQTKIFFYSHTSLTGVRALINQGIEMVIPAEQSPVIDLYVTADVYANQDIRARLTTSTISLLDTYIDQTQLSMSDLTASLRTLYGDTVSSLTISNFGGPDLGIVPTLIVLVDQHNRLCLRKRLVLQPDGTTIVEEDISINFHSTGL
jgi:hypothetical protein